MLTLILISVLLCFALLVVCVSIGVKLLRIKPTTVTVPAPAPTVAEIPLRSDLVEVVVKHGDEWHHHGWIQDGSAAHADVLRRPGLAIRRGAEIDLGNQE